MYSQTVFVTGGSGFVGTAVIDALVERGHSVRALIRPRGRPIPGRGGRVTAVPGELTDPAALAAGLAGCDAVIHLIGIIAERPRAGVTFERVHVDGTRAVVEATQRAGVRRYIHMSALGSRPDAVTDYHKTKWRAEEIVRASGLDWTIIRPSLIHGPRGDFTRMQTDWVRRRAFPYLFMPYFAGGLLGRDVGRDIQPVCVGDVARAFADAMEKPATAGQTYDLGGPDRMTWPEMHRAFARVLTGKPRAAVGIPRWYATALTYVTPAALLPFTRTQVKMAAEDNVADLGPFRRDFGWTPQAFEAAVEEYRGELSGDGRGRM